MREADHEMNPLESLHSLQERVDTRAEPAPEADHRRSKQRGR